MCWRKYGKAQKLFCFSRKEITKIDKDGNEGVVTICYNVDLCKIYGKFMIKSC